MEEKNRKILKCLVYPGKDSILVNKETGEVISFDYRKVSRLPLSIDFSFEEEENNEKEKSEQSKEEVKEFELSDDE